MRRVSINYYYHNPTWKRIAQQNLPYLPTPFEVVEQIFLWLNENIILSRGKRLIDLGAGDGRIILHASKYYKLSAIGLEINEELINSVKDKIHKEKLENSCKIIEADFYNYDVSNFDFIYSFIIPDTQSAFKQILNRMKKNAILIFIKWPYEEKYEKLKFLGQILPLEPFPVYFYQKIA